MKISINNIQKNYSDLQIQSKETHKSLASLSESEFSNFDQLLIQSDPKQIEESSFMESLSKQLPHEVSSSEKDFEKIKSQVQNHTYQIDAQAIASRILLLGEGL